MSVEIQMTKPTPPLPPGPFQVITADPPWRYSFSRSRKTAIERDYQTMSPEAIAALSVPEIAAKNSICYLWATAPKIKQALAVLESWGFRYVSQWIWHKLGSPGLGYHSRVDHELVLIGVRGKPGVAPPAARRSSVFTSKKGRHSEKPEEVYEQIDRLYPEARRIELF